MEALSLLQRFSEESKVVVEEEEEEGSEEIEVNLNLGLSLGGRFGVDKSSSSKLVRSSSIAGSIPVLSGTAAGLPPALARTASLPVETEEQWRKRKELQSLRRMEAKRRRSEKQRSSSAAAPAGLEEIDGEDLKEKQHFATENRSGLAGLPSWAAAARTAVETVGGSSSGNSELESKTSQGQGSCGEARSSAGSIQSNQEESEKANKNECSTPKATGREGAMEDMPCVFTKGDGPDGRRVDGILYKYGKGEEVRIMCVCHGSFLSPADFVKHAGGRDVSHPLRHIVINPSASTSLS